MTKINDEYIYSRIGMALVSAQRVEFITGQLLEVLETFDGGAYKITTNEFLERTAKSKKAIKTLGTIFALLKLNPKLIIEDELDDYLKKRNLFVHRFWYAYMQTKDEKQGKIIVDFLYDFGRHSERIESFFKGFVYFLTLRFVKDRDHLPLELKGWSENFEYFMNSLENKKLLSRDS
jgi:hypothetical protein